MSNKYDPILGAYRQADTVDLSGYVPYTGATQNVDLGAFNITASALKALGTTEQMRLSYDASNYLTTTVASNGAITNAVITASGSLGGSYNISAGNSSSTVDFTSGGSVEIVSGTTASQTDKLGDINCGQVRLRGADAGSVVYTASGLLGSATGFGGAAIVSSGTGGALTVANGAALDDSYCWGGQLQITAGSGGTFQDNRLTSTIGTRGGTCTFQSGFGGSVTTASNKAFTMTGGLAGALNFTAGNGGSSTGSSTQNTGGAGGAFSFTGGTGGSASGAGNNTGGTGSSLSFTSGNGGTPTVRASFTARGGNGGNITFIGAGGVNVSGTNAIGGNSGIITFQARAGGTGTASNGTDGYIVFQSATSSGGSVTERMRMTTGGNFGYGVTVPTAVIHLKAGTATASTAPLKFTSGTLTTVAEAGAFEFLTDKFYGTITTGASRKEFIQGDNAITDAVNLVFGTTTGTKLGTATTQKLGLWNATPIVQPTTAVAAATFASPGAGVNIKTDDTFDGYTVQQVVRALREFGLLA